MTNSVEKKCVTAWIQLEYTWAGCGIHKDMIRLTLFDVAEKLQLDGPWLLKQLRCLEIMDNHYVPKPIYVEQGYFDCVIEPNPCMPQYGMLSVFVTSRGVLLICYLVIMMGIIQYQGGYAIGPKIETYDASKLE